MERKWWTNEQFNETSPQMATDSHFDERSTSLLKIGLKK